VKQYHCTDRAALIACVLAAVLVVFPGVSAHAPSAQSILDTSKPLDESVLFGGAEDIVRVIDTATAAAGTIQLTEDTTHYPVFIIEGNARAGVSGDYVPYGAKSTDTQTIFGTVQLNSVALGIVPAKDVAFMITTDASLLPSGVRDLSLDASADLRISEFTRFHASASWKYNISSSSTSLVTTEDGLSVDEVFLDAALDRRLFFRLGKQNISWGVGYWFKPADVLSLAAIDPDDPEAVREGPFAFKLDMPFGLNHATLYAVPPLDGDAAKFSLAQRTDIVAGDFELSLAGFYRSDLSAKPRAMFMFSGAVGNIDIYGENVLALGSDRPYVRSASGGGYETWDIGYQPLFQGTLGAKYSWETAGGLSVNLHAQGYYNGAGYADSSILQSNDAVDEVLKATGIAAPTSSMRSALRAGAGMYYAAASASLSTRFGEGKNIVSTALGSNLLANFSDLSFRFKPYWDLSIGSGGSTFDMTLSALTSLGETGSEYAPRGNMVTPAISFTILKDMIAQLSAPLYLYSDNVVDRAGLAFSLYWNVVDFGDLDQGK
jgi:hypothetical protein